MAKRVENEYGLTFEEWLAAAGGRAHVEAVMAFGMTPRAAWRGGEDPTEYRAADASRIRALKESSESEGERPRQPRLPKVTIGVRLKTWDGTGYVVEVRPYDDYSDVYRFRIRRDEDGQLSKWMNDNSGDFTRLRRGSSNRAGTRSTTKTRKSPLTAPASYQVYADGSEIWSGTSRRDAENAFDEYAHDNYEGKRYVDAEIVLQRGSKTVRSFGPTHSHPRYFHRGANRAGSKNAKRTNPLTAATRVATLASLGVVHDSSLFYSVKGGKLYARARTGGGGYGRGRLGKAKLLGTIPGFKKGVFYSVSNGVISVRKRK